MAKHTMTQAAAKRVAERLLDGWPESGDLPYLDTESWRKALAAEGFSGFVAMNASDVIGKLRYADQEALADALMRFSFEALLREAMDLREGATRLVNAFGGLAKHRL